MLKQIARTTFTRNFIVGLLLGVVIAAAGIGIVTASGITDDDASGEIEDIAPGALNVTDSQAREVVLGDYPNTTIEEVDLDSQADGTLVYDVSLDNGKEIMVDARTGKLLGEEADDADNGSDDDDH